MGEFALFVVMGVFPPKYGLRTHHAAARWTLPQHVAHALLWREVGSWAHAATRTGLRTDMHTERHTTHAHTAVYVSQQLTTCLERLQASSTLPKRGKARGRSAHCPWPRD